MKIQSLLAIALPAAISTLPIAASANQTIAYGSNSPITVQTANVDSFTTNIGSTFAPMTLRSTDGLRVRFVNNAGVAATNVELAVKYNGTTETIEDRGNFAPGTSIAHGYSALGNVPFVGDSADVKVTAVQFADGSTWHLTGNNG